jgi:hypothetical protein
MAETGKKTQDDTSSQSTDSPTKASKDSGYVRVRTRYPHSSFSVEGVPTIDTEGIIVTKEQSEKALSAAPAYGVKLAVEDVK